MTALNFRPKSTALLVWAVYGRALADRNLIPWDVMLEERKARDRRFNPPARRLGK